MKTMIRPQKGPQECFLATPADIAIFGGAAGGGKTFSLLLSPLRYKNVNDFSCTIFRKNFNQIFSQGGLWSEAEKMYRQIPGAVKKYGDAAWVFCDKDGRQLSKVDFKHIERYDEVHKFQGAQIAEICFDELIHFDRQTFFYMLSRNRSTCGVKPFVRATCNPDAGSWVAEFIDWWIDQETGYPAEVRKLLPGRRS